MTLTTVDEYRLSKTFAALANPIRRAILTRLANGEATVNELAGSFDVTLPAVSKHIKVLEQAGLVVRAQRAQYRPCALNAAALEEVSSWAGQQRRLWEQRFDRAAGSPCHGPCNPRTAGTPQLSRPRWPSRCARRRRRTIVVRRRPRRGPVLPLSVLTWRPVLYEIMIS
jgi:DNA-binding transcriptional ArsR family regulator